MYDFKKFTEMYARGKKLNKVYDLQSNRLVYDRDDGLTIRGKVKKSGMFKFSIDKKYVDYILIDSEEMNLSELTGFGGKIEYETDNEEKSVIFKIHFKDTFKDLDYAFYGNKDVSMIDFTSLNSSKVTSVYNLFYNCSNLQLLDLSNFDTSHVTNMSYMFSNCSRLQSLDLSNFDTSKVTNMSNMFYNCESLTSLDLSNFDTSHVTNMSYMFSIFNSNLVSLNLSSFDTSQVTNYSSMFSYSINRDIVEISDKFTLPI